MALSGTESLGIDRAPMTPQSASMKAEKLIAEKCGKREIFLQSIFLPVNHADGDLGQRDNDSSSVPAHCSLGTAEIAS
jgi:hypothetical protein